MRDKNKLKKLLTLLTIGTIGLTPVAGVVACGTTQKGDNNDNGGNDNDNQNVVVDISVIENDLKTLVESKTDSVWETTGENSILNQTLGGSTEYKDKTLSDLGIDVECLNPDAQADENGLVEYNFKFTVNDSSNYLIAGSTITLTQNVLSSDKSYYSIYLDADENKVASNSIPDGITTVLRLGTNEDGTKFVSSIPDSVTKVIVGAHTGITSLGNLFKDKTGLEYVDLTGLDTSQVTSMTKMFFGCSKLETINGLNGFVTANTTDASFMFANCSSLKSIDTTNWDTSQVTNIKFMFCGCVNLETIVGIETWDMTSLNYTANIFAINYNATGGDTSSDIDPLPNDAGTKLTCPNLSGWTVAFFPTDFVTNSKFEELNGYDESKNPQTKASESKYMDADGKVQECYGDIPDGATEVLYLGTNKDGTKFVSIPDSVTKVTVGAHTGITSLNSAFKNKTNLKTVDFTDLDTSNVTDMRYAFAGCSSLEKVIGIEDTSNVSSMYQCFVNCYALKSIDTTNWNTSQVTSMYQMFSSCYLLTSVNTTGWDTSKVNDMSYMFTNCYSLTSLDLSSFNTSNVTEIDHMFRGCYSLTNIEGIENWDMSSLTSYKYAFAVNCDSSGKVIDGQDVLLNCPDLSDWTVPSDFDQSDFISSSKFDELIDYDASKAPSYGQTN